ncbi:MAG: NADH-ubiquinone oxidoreductase-F iron-sulfur binding region domain-containing protein, partial [Bacteriovoracia bacterium]
MAKVLYGYWNKKLYDNRGKHLFEIEPSPALKEFDEFDPGTPIKAYFGHKGFFVFDNDLSLINSFLLYLNRAAEESCGKCTPCRVGVQILKQKFQTLASGEGKIEDLDEIQSLADHVKRTSLCGLGQSATVALLYVLKHFRDELEKEIKEGNTSSEEKAYSYVTTPCIEACPAKVDVPKYIDYIKDGKFTHSVGVVLKKYPWAATCGRVCVRFCELACKRTHVDEAVGIKVLKRFVADREKY